MADQTVSLHRESLSQQVSESLTKQILSGEYKPGEVLPSESTLSQRYGVSRPVIREALKLLWAQGMVESHAGKGAVVQELSDKPLRLFFERALGLSEPRALLDLLVVRKELESTSAELAALHRSEEKLEQLRELLGRMDRAKEDFDRYSRLDVEFHIQLATCSENSFLYYLTVSIRESLVKVINELRIHAYQSSPDQVHGFHEDIFNAVEAKDPVAARDAMSRHFQSVIDRVRRAMGDSGDIQSQHV